MDLFNAIDQWAGNHEFVNQSIHFYGEFLRIHLTPLYALELDIALFAVIFHFIFFLARFMMRNGRTAKAFRNPIYVGGSSRVDDVIRILNFRAIRRDRKAGDGEANPVKREKK